jgi:hypothetical protein
MTAAALEAITGLTAATEAANILAKTSTGLMEVVGKALSSIVNLFIQPLAPLMTYLLSQLVFALINFKAWWDGLPKWFDEKIFTPIKEWVQKYIIDPILGIKDSEAYKWLVGFFSFKWVWDIVDRVKDSEAYKWLIGFVSFKWLWDVVDKIKDSEQYKWLVGFASFKWVWEVVDKIKESSSYKWLLGFSSFKWVWEVVDKIKDSESYKWLSGFASFKWLWNEVDKIKENPAYKFLTGIPSVVGKAIHNIIASVNNAIANSPLGWVSGLHQMEIQSYASGGTVPGHGAQLAIVHGGETISPAGQGGSNITLNFYGYQDDKFVQKVKDVLRSQGTVYNL